MNLRRNAHAVIIGINAYQDEKIPKLQFARADADGVYQILTDPELGRIPPENVILLLDENATQQNIRSAIGDEILSRAGENDFVYMYFAGHGLPFMNPKSGSADGMEKYLVPVDAKLDKIRGTGIPMDDIQRFFGYIQSKQVMFFIDSCFSGEAGGRTFQNPAFQTRHGLLTPEFLDQLSGEGRLVVTACDVNELSIETSAMGHGLFTHYLMEGLKGRADKDRDGLVTIHELYDYVYENVSQHALKLGGSMHPIQKGSIKGKIPLTVYETAAQKQARELHAQAQALFKAGKFGEAYELWHQVLDLVPDHSDAEQGLAEVENWLKEKERKRQEILERKQRVLLSFFRDGQLPLEEFDAAMELIEKSEDELAAVERETRRLLDALVGKKISAASYVKSVRLLRKPAEPESAPQIEKETPVVPKIESEKIPEANSAIPTAELAVEKPKPVAHKIRPPKTPIPEEKQLLPVAARDKWIIAILLVLIVLFGVAIVAAMNAVSFHPIILFITSGFVIWSPIAFFMVFKKEMILSTEQLKTILANTSFYNSHLNQKDDSITQNYMEQTLHGHKVVLDKATNLLWQQSGSPNYMNYASALKYIRDLNNKSFAGFMDWRLPTLNEAISLMELKKHGDLYIDSIFDQKQMWIWTTDKDNIFQTQTWIGTVKKSKVAWWVRYFLYFFLYFLDRFFYFGMIGDRRYVRAARSGH